MIDEPKSLGDAKIREERLKLLNQEHIQPLTDFVHKMRKEKELADEIPFFDPLDGGVNARCLFVMESPGKKANASGFISRNNPDPTAENLFNFFKEAGIPRSQTVLWNIVPWSTEYAKHTPEVSSGTYYLKEFLMLLPNLEAVVFSGLTSQRAIPELEQYLGDRKIEIIKCWHPGNLAQKQPNKKLETIEAFEKLAALLQIPS